MLSVFQKNKKSIIGLICGGFAIILMASWGIDSRGRGSLSKNHPTQDAIRVNENNITIGEFENELLTNTERAKSQLGENFGRFRSMLNLEQRTIDQLIEKRLLTDFLTQLGMTAGLDQIQQEISSDPFFQKFGLTHETLAQYLGARGITGEQLEQQASIGVALKQLQATLGDLTLPTEQELRAVYLRDNTKYSFAYLSLAPADFQSKVERDDAKIQAFFDQHIDQYKKPRTVKYAFVRFDPSEFLAQSEVSEEDIQERYLSNQNKYAIPKEIHLSKIVFRKVSDEPSALEALVAPEAKGAKVDPNETKQNIAKTVVDRLRGGEEFAKIAKEVSEDETTKAQGGDIGWVNLSGIDKELRPVADRLEVGKYSDVIETPDSFVVLFVHEVKDRSVKDLSLVHDDIKTELQSQDAPEYARVAADEFLMRWQEATNVSLADFAAKNGRKVVQTERLLPATEDIPEGSAGLTKALVTVPQGERMTQRAGGIDFVAEVLESKDAYLPQLADVKEAVTKDFIAEQSRTLAKEAAEKAQAELVKGGAPEGLEAIAVKFGGSAKATEPTTPKAAGSNELASIPEATRIGFTLTPESPNAPSVVEGNGSFIVLRLKSRVAPDEGEFTVKRDEILKAERQAIQQRSLEYLIQTLRGSATIWINPYVLDKTRPTSVDI